jgi:hypothetical protein
MGDEEEEEINVRNFNPHRSLCTRQMESIYQDHFIFL